MESEICPYPGLRPFTEEESIFFKGRDLHIRQIAKLLEENKMAFITGASGDGKSSMVYAGVLPYIRAGFFKADFNNWIIADFKPKRNPLQSLTESLAKETGLDENYCYNELDNGFSAIANIYQNNGFYVTEGENAVNQGKNLLIIADQFEEIFTNTSNFDNGIPSEESYTTVNLLLETVRIAVAENLPIYVIFTMRSDFISQCTVFKNLPEFIAYSQFFVPQLKRAEIVQVIEEPAQLAGSSVSSRLTEVLVNNLSNGFDYLPVLQHTMHQLWEVADNGKSQLDLIHLAKIAGISKDVLSPEDQAEFDKWFATLPLFERKYYEKPGLSNVLNTHAGILYESAFDYFTNKVNWAQKNITREESELIIATVFKSLVKIDNGRPVRNRCTLDEITGSVNREHITNATVCGCINIFRMPENTLLRPFLDPEKLDTQYLSGDSVLDITHEALIRNWKLLTQWNADEEAYVKDYYDFKSQMMRWDENDRRNEFLLPEGNLVYFETWKQNCNLNPYWIAKYEDSKLPQAKKLSNADVEYHKSCDFLSKSRETIVAADKQKKRKQKILLGAILAVMALLAGLTLWALNERNFAQQQEIRANWKAKEAENQMKVNERERIRLEAAEATADKERKKAVTEAMKARDAMKNAEQAYIEADAARILADSMKNVALNNLTSAENARAATEEALKIANEQTRKADAASDSARRLYNTAVSNALSMKAQNHYEDKAMNLRLAWSAWLMCRDCGITRNTAELYQAMLFAMKENGFDNKLEVTSNKISDFYVDNDNNLFVITENAQVIGYKILGDKPKEYINFQDKGISSPIQKAFFLSGKNAIFCTKDKKMYIANITKQTVTPLAREGYINAAAISKDGRMAITAMSNGDILAWNMIQDNTEPIAMLNLGDKIADVKIGNGDDVYALMLRGTLIKCNVTGGTPTTIMDKSPHTASALALIEDKKLVASALADGTINYTNTESNLSVDIPGGTSKLGTMAYDPKTGLLARSSADKRILIVDTNNFTMQPYTIEEYNLNGGKVNAIKFNSKGVIFVLTDLNELRYWDTDINKYANSLKTLNLTPLSSREKQTILGNEFVGDYD
ncbi:MAG: hypothetical protein K6F33_09810 [Bacteroidales bacterium]|nr:hypothetical protein [Bacteroidales bacterium]